MSYLESSPAPPSLYFEFRKGIAQYNTQGVGMGKLTKYIFIRDLPKNFLLITQYWLCCVTKRRFRSELDPNNIQNFQKPVSAWTLETGSTFSLISKFSQTTLNLSQTLPCGNITVSIICRNGSADLMSVLFGATLLPTTFMLFGGTVLPNNFGWNAKSILFSVATDKYTPGTRGWFSLRDRTLAVPKKCVKK